MKVAECQVHVKAPLRRDYTSRKFNAGLTYELSLFGGTERRIEVVVMKMTHMKHVPESCDDCLYFSTRPHPYKGWTDGCELCMQCLDDDQEDDWIFDGNGRPKNCPLMEVDEPQSGGEQ